MDNKLLIVGGTALIAGAGAGFGAGYIVAKKKFEKIANEEIEAVKEAYAKAAQNAEKPDPEVLAEQRRRREENQRRLQEANMQEIKDILEDNQYTIGNDETDADAFRRAYGRVPTSEELVRMGEGVNLREAGFQNRTDDPDSGTQERNIFDYDPETEPDPEELGESQDPEDPISLDRPYIISVEEWFLNELNYDQIPLMYWADDSVLCDDANRIIPRPEEVVGTTALSRFGTKSEDADKVYIRNPIKKADYEITKDERGYAEVVHKAPRGSVNNSGVPRRMRGDDE